MQEQLDFVLFAIMSAKLYQPFNPVVLVLSSNKFPYFQQKKELPL